MTTQICRNLCDCAPREGAVVVVVAALLFALEIQTNMSLLRTHSPRTYICMCMCVCVCQLVSFLTLAWQLCCGHVRAHLGAYSAMFVQCNRTREIPNRAPSVCH